MKTKLMTGWNSLIIATLAAALPAIGAETSPGGFTSEPDKTLAAAHESFVKKETNKAADQIHKAAAGVKKESENVARGSKETMKKAGDELDKLGEGVKKGTVKSEAELRKTFAKVDHQISTCWHQTAEEARKSGKDSDAALKKAGDSLDGAAKWSGAKLKEGTQSSVEAVKKFGKSTGESVKAGAKEVDKWFKDIGEGIKDFGGKL